MRLLTGIVVSLALALPSSAGAFSLGVSDHWVQRGLFGPSTPAQVAYVGADVVRLAFHWQDPVERHRLTEWVPIFHRAGIETVLTPYADHPPRLWPWTRMLGWLDRTFPFATVGVWNEPNLSAYGALDPQRYARLLRRTIETLHRLGHRGRILGEAGFITPCAPQAEANWLRWVAQRTADLRYTVSMHVYLGPCPLTDPASVARRIWRIVTGYQPGRDTWVTETGYPSNGGEALQATVVLGFLQTLRALGAERVFVYRLNDSDPSLFGAMRSDGTWKPLGRALHLLFGA